MTHVTPFILQAGRGVQGSSLGYHAYSLRVDNLSNQWLQEESTLVWIPPYSLGVVLRLWGTSVALIIPSAPVGQPQLAAINGEYAVAVFSDEFRTENPGVPVRQFTLVQAVSDLTQGPQPALPPVGVDRIWADTNGEIHHLHSNGTDAELADLTDLPAIVLGGDLNGTVSNGHVTLANNSPIQARDSGGVAHQIIAWGPGNNLNISAGSAGMQLYSQDATSLNVGIDASGNVNIARGNLSVAGTSMLTGVVNTGGALNAGAQITLGAGQFIQFVPAAASRTDYIYFGGNGSLANAQGSSLVFRRSYDSTNVGTLTGAGTLTVLGNATIQGGNLFITNSSAAIASDGAAYVLVVSPGYIAFRTPSTVQCQNAAGSNYSNMIALGYNVANAPNSANAPIALPQSIGPKISLYDAGGGQFYGFGINSAELTIVVPSSSNLAMRQNTMSGGIVMFFAPNGSLTIQPGGVSTPPATTQAINMPNSYGIGWRNVGNTADCVIGCNNSNQLTLQNWLTSGTAGTLAGYIFASFNGTNVKIPYYNP